MIIVIARSYENFYLNAIRLNYDKYLKINYYDNTKNIPIYEYMEVGAHTSIEYE